MLNYVLVFLNAAFENRFLDIAFLPFDFKYSPNLFRTIPIRNFDDLSLIISMLLLLYY